MRAAARRRGMPAGDPMSSDPINLCAITISRVIDEDGRMAVHFKMPDKFSALEMLGMLEMAKSQIFHDLEERRQ